MSTRRHHMKKKNNYLSTENIKLFLSFICLYIILYALMHHACTVCTHINMCKHLYNLRLSNVLENQTK